MINTNLTSIRWRKSLYYVSEGVIFDIRNNRRPNDKDECETLLIDFSKADEVSKNAAVGATVNLTNQTELFEGLPWIEVKFDDSTLDIAIPLQYLIEEGDTFINESTGQAHPNVYDKDYRNKFNQEIFEYIGNFVTSRNTLTNSDFVQLMASLPAWLTCNTGNEMARTFAINNFLKGRAWDETATVGDDMVTLEGVFIHTPMGDACISDSWTEENIRKAALAFYAAKVVSTLNIPADMKEYIANDIIDNGVITDSDIALTALHHIDYTGGGTVTDVEFMAKATNADTYWEYENEPEPDHNPVWEEQSRETTTECVQEDGENTGMAIKTTVITYLDTNEYSETYNQTKTETETETVEDLISCPLPEHDKTPNWVEQGRETTTECVREDGKNTGMAIKTTVITYLDTNEYSDTYNQTKTETETETVEDLISCPLPEPEPEIPSKPDEIVNTPEQEQTAQDTISDIEAQIAETGKAATVTIPEGQTLGNITLPNTLTKGVTINGEIADGATIRNESTQYMTINNTGSAVDIIIDAKGDDTNGTVYPKGEYNDIYTDSSLSGSSSTYATVHGDVTIDENCNKATTISAHFTEGESHKIATASDFDGNNLTISNVKNPDQEETEPSIEIMAPNASVIANGKYDEVVATVSENTLTLNTSFHANKLTVLKGNVVINGLDIDDFCNEFVGEGTITPKSYDTLKTEPGVSTLNEDTEGNGLTFSAFATGKSAWYLNNHTYTMKRNMETGIVLLRNEAQLNIYGPGKMTSNGANEHYGIWSASEDNVTNIYGGDFEAYTHTLYAEQGTINVYGGTFKLLNADAADRDQNGLLKFLLNCKDENYTAGTAHINVYGGKFYEFNPAEVYGEPGSPVSYVAPGYTVTETEEDGKRVFEVVPVAEP